jgi:hypothetical protein
MLALIANRRWPLAAGAVSLWQLVRRLLDQICRALGRNMIVFRNSAFGRHNDFLPARRRSGGTSNFEPRKK